MPIITPIFLFLVLSSFHEIINVHCCYKVERDALLSFHHHIISYASLNWSSTTNCCHWEGISCTSHDHNAHITHLWLPGKHLSGTINLSLSNLSFLSHINLSHNHFSGPSPLPHLLSSNSLQTLDLSYNRLSGPLHRLPRPSSAPSIRTLDLSSNLFNGHIQPLLLPNMISFNVSNNTLTGLIPSAICKASPLVEILDFSLNQFTGNLLAGFSECRRLEVVRAGSNLLFGRLPNHFYAISTLKQISLPYNHFFGTINNIIVTLSNLTLLELQGNDLSGEIPREIGALSNLEQLQLHTNNLNGTLPPSLTRCSKLTILLLRNNNFVGDISLIDFSKLGRLHAIDLGNNSFVGKIPDSLCSCRSINAIRLTHNQLVGEVPSCMASLISLKHLAISDNRLSNIAGALETLRQCNSLEVLFMSRCFHEEMMPNLYLRGFENLQILTLGGANLKGEIPGWISKLKKLKVLNLSYNRLRGRIPTWVGEMPSLSVLNITQNFLTGELPREIGEMSGLIGDNTSSDLTSLALPFLYDSHQYNRLFNLPRGLKVGSNNLSGSIPEEIGRLRLLQELDLSNNEFNGSLPSSLSRLNNLEKLDLSGNHLSGEIPETWTRLHFLSSFSVAKNDLQGQILRGGQFETFPLEAFEGNPKLCGYILKRECHVHDDEEGGEEEVEDYRHDSWLNGIVTFGFGYSVGLVAITITLLCKHW